MLLYRILRFFSALYCFLTHPIKVHGKEHLRYSGKMMVICNHLGNHDPIIVHLVCKGRPSFMAKKELFKNRFLTAVLKDLGAFPVDRGAGDRAAIVKSVEVLNEGGTLGMFPEGSRNRESEEVGTFMNGAAVIALRADAPVLPLCILRRPRLFRVTHVAAGAPVDLGEVTKDEVRTSDKIRKATAYLREQVRSLKENTKLK